MSMLVLVFLCALTLSTNPAQAMDCLIIVNNILSCRVYLKNPDRFYPGTECCDALRNIKAAANDADVCKCIRHYHLASPILIPSKAAQHHPTPGICDVSGLAQILHTCVGSDPPTTDRESSKTFIMPFPFTFPYPFNFPPLTPGDLPPVTLPPPALTPAPRALSPPSSTSEIAPSGSPALLDPPSLTPETAPSASLTP